MKNVRLFSRNWQGGFIGALLAVLLAAAALLGIFYSAIKNAPEYNRMHRIAQEVAADPNSHTDAEITNAGEQLYNVMKSAVESGTSAPGVGGGLGVKELIKVEDALRRARLQQYVIKISVNPPDPGPLQGVDVTLEIINAGAGVAVTYSLSGTDGYAQGATLSTDQSGKVSFHVPGGAAGVKDTFTVKVGPVTEIYSYVF